MAKLTKTHDANPIDEDIASFVKELSALAADEDKGGGGLLVECAYSGDMVLLSEKIGHITTKSGLIDFGYGTENFDAKAAAVAAFEKSIAAKFAAAAKQAGDNIQERYRLMAEIKVN